MTPPTKLKLSHPFLASLAIFLASAWCAEVSDAQEKPEPQIPFAFSKTPMNCETNLFRIETITRLAVSEIDQGGVLIAIARIGDGERSRELNQRRLHNIQAYLTEYQPMKPRDVVTAEGSRVEGYGRVEIYLGGKLVDVFLIQRNKDICVDCCDIDERYYPYRKDGKRRQ